MRSSTRFIGTAVAVVAALSIAGGVAASSTVVVRPGDVGTSWLATAKPGGSSSFVTGPATAPSGVGSLQFTTADVTASAHLFNNSYVGTPLANFDAMSYEAYRASSSTNPKEQTIALALAVDVNGPAVADGFATLIFEPDYQAGGNAAMQLDTWQTWDAFQSGNAIWWANKDIPGAPVAYNTFVSWNTILAANPQATIAGGVGPFIGSGWAGQFTGNVDNMKIGVSGNTTTYNFEPMASLTVTAPNAAKVQGDANPAFVPTFTGFVLGDTAASLITPPICTTTAIASSPVGTYPITCSGATSANYSIIYVAGTLTVTAAPIEIIAGATGTPVNAVTPPTTSANGESSGGGDSTPLFALLLCLAFGSFGLFAVEAQRRNVRR
ncbi:MAG TPA: MBG domain-containing protein [Candidatus Limnocylindrales bacterium]